MSRVIRGSPMSAPAAAPKPRSQGATGPTETKPLADRQPLSVVRSQLLANLRKKSVITQRSVSLDVAPDSGTESSQPLSLHSFRGRTGTESSNPTSLDWDNYETATSYGPPSGPSAGVDG